LFKGPQAGRDLPWAAVFRQRVIRRLRGGSGRVAINRTGVCNQHERSDAVGLIDKISGRAKKAAGDLADDPKLRRQGSREERKGEAKEELAQQQDRVERKAEEVTDLERKTS
jgi:uncharacterized protein YjbJ (UPF0337 family)